MATRRSKYARHRRPGRTQERAFFAQHEETGPCYVAGIDEVGRGAWAGPVVAAAVILPEPCATKSIRDSKLLRSTERQRAAKRLLECAVSVGIGVVTVAEINEHGLTWAVRQSGWRALHHGSLDPHHVLLDGKHNYLRESHSSSVIIGGDRTELCVAAASIIAKVHRDRLMGELDAVAPEFGFARHKGYGVVSHQRALARYGPSVHHRARYAPIVALQATI